MAYRIAVEDIEPNHWVVWGLDLPGFFTRSRTQEEAIALAPTELSRYFAWLRNHGYRNLPRQTNLEVEVVESFKSYVRDGMFIINAFFEDDLRPLEAEEVEFCLWLLDRTREDLIASVDQISPERRETAVQGEIHVSIIGILEHVAWTEWWAVERLDLAPPREEMPSDTYALMDAVREQTKQVLPDLIGKELVIEKDKERWSPRKSLRRVLWHERDHTHHIMKLGTYI
ncbi:MAG: DinB family protein [Anaerolineales bacterium]|nr:DinB family protein [Anaerolineales bacterium]